MTRNSWFSAGLLSSSCCQIDPLVLERVDVMVSSVFVLVGFVVLLLIMVGRRRQEPRQTAKRSELCHRKASARSELSGSGQDASYPEVCYNLGHSDGVLLQQANDHELFRQRRVLCQLLASYSHLTIVFEVQTRWKTARALCEQGGVTKIAQNKIRDGFPPRNR